MRTVLLYALALCALTSAALAEAPLTLTDEQMDKVTAGHAKVVAPPPHARGEGQGTTRELPSNQGIQRAGEVSRVVVLPH